MKSGILKGLTGCLLLLCSGAVLANCNMALRYGVLISPEHIRLVHNGRTSVQINHDQQLFIRGELIQLNEQEVKLVREYSQGLRRFVPELVTIAIDGVELGLTNIETMLSGVGSRSQQVEWRELIREIKYRIMSRFVRTGDHFYLAPQSLDELDKFLHGELKPQLNNLARHTVGAVWGALQDALLQSELNFENQNDEDWQFVGKLIDKINVGLDEKTSELEEKSVLFCDRLRELDRIEHQLQQNLPVLLQYDVVIEKS